MKSIFPLAMMIVSTLVVAQAYAESTQSPFACDRLALNSKARKRHFDQLDAAAGTDPDLIRCQGLGQGAFRAGGL